VRSSGGAPAPGGLAPGHAGLDEPDRPGGAAWRARGRRRRVLLAGAWTAGTATAFAVYLRLAQTRAVNSDGASQALQAWDMLHGNPLLRGWTTSDVSFYPTELPQYALVELVRGLRADVVTTCAAMTYTLVVLLAALVAAGRGSSGEYGSSGQCGDGGYGEPSPRRQAALRVAVAAGILLAPQLGAGTNQLLSSPDHIGTSVPLLLTWLVLDRAGRRWYVPVITSALLCWAEVADSIAVVAGIVPLALVCAVRAAGLAWRRPGGDVRRIRYELSLAGGALAAAPAAGWILRAISEAGGFTVRPLSTRLAPPGEIFWHNLPVAGQCVLVLFGAYPGGPSTREVMPFLLLHLAGVAFAGAGVAFAGAGVALAGAGAVASARRLRRCGGAPGGGGDLVSQVLLAAIAVNVGAFLVTERAVDVTAAREIAPALPFAAALAARQLAPSLGRLPAGRPASWLLIALGAGYVAGLGVELTAPSAPPQAAPLSAWLARHPLGGSGLGGYWQASVVTLTTGGTVAVRPVADDGAGVGAHPGEIKDSWFDPARASAHFVVLAPGAPGFAGYADYRAVRATWGSPARVYHAGQYTIWYWPANLLAAIRH
jgi:hypothetical protein